MILVADLGQLGGGRTSLLGLAAPLALISRQERTDRRDRHKTVRAANQRRIAPFRLDPTAGNVMISGYMEAGWGICYGRGID